MSTEPRPVSLETRLAIRRALVGETSANRVARVRHAIEVWLLTLSELEGPIVAASLAYALADELVT